MTSIPVGSAAKRQSRAAIDVSRPSLLWVNHFAVTPAEGGGTRHFELGRELVRSGWGVTIAASDFNLHARRYTRRPAAESRESVSETVEGVRFEWLWASSYERNDWRRGRNWLTFASGVARWRLPVAPSVVIGSSPHLLAAAAAARLATRHGVPFVLEVRDLWPESLLAAGGRVGPAYLALDALARRLYRRAERIMVLARGVGERIHALGVPSDKIVYVPNGVDVSAFVASERRPPADDRFTVVYAGAHGPANGLDTVLEAAALLRDEPGLRFLLVGDGPAKGELEAKARARGLATVEFRPPVPKREMPALLATADAGLMVLRPSPLFAYGVSPNKLFDYLGAALPVVCNVPGDVAGMVRESGAGVQAVDASPSALAEAVLGLRKRGDLARRRMGEAGRAWVEREHGRPVLAARLDAMLRGLVAD